MSDETARLVERLRHRLRRALRRMTWAELAFGGALGVACISALWLLAVALEAAFWLPPDLRTGLVVLAGAALLGVGAAFLARPLGRLLGVVDGPSEEDVARSVGEHHPAVSDRLVNLLQLAEGRRSHAPAPYVDRAVQHLAEQVDEVEFDEVADFQPARRVARWAMLPVLAVFAFLLTAPSTFLGASERLLAPQTEFDRPAPFQLSVTPGPTRLVKGDSLDLTVRTSGTVPETATLLLRSRQDERPQRIGLESDSLGTFRYTVPNVRRPLRYRVVASPVRTEWFEVEVVNRPFLRQLQLRVTPPSYTGRPARDLAPNVGDVNALPGARVRVTAGLGGAPVADAALNFDEGTSQPLSVADDSATGTFVVQQEDTYVVRLRSDNDIPNRDPIRYEVAPQADARPSVTFLKPDSPAELTPALTQDLRLQLSDDYGFRRVALFYRKVEGTGADSSFSSVELSLPQPRQVDQVLRHTWLLAQESGLSLERGDAVAYYAKVWDNDTVNGPKSGRTAVQRLRFPSLSEQYEDLNQLQQETGEQMRQLNQESESIQQQFQKLREELRRTRQADWEDRRQLEQMQQQQNSLSEEKEELSRKVDSLNRERQRNDLSSPETSEKFRELQRTIEDMESKDLQEALDQLRKAMQNRSFRQMQQSMETTESRLDQQRRQLERTLNLFKQLQARQRMEELTRRAKNLSEREQEIGDKTEERMTSPSDSTQTPESPSSDSAATDARPSPSDSTAATPSDSTGASPTDSTAASTPSDSTSSPSSDSLSAQQSSTPDSSANEDLAQEQEQLAKEMEKLMESMKQAEQEMKDTPSAPQKRLQQLRKQMQQQNLPKKMRQNSQQLRQNRLRKARQQQKGLQKQLQRMQSQLSQMQQQMQSQQRQMNVRGLRSALENTLRLSKNQESLRQTVESLTGGGPTVRRYARRQQDLSDGLEAVADSLHSIASRVPEMSQTVQKQTGNALRAMEKSTTALDKRKAKQATGFQKTSMMHLNELALLLSSLLDQMQQQGGGSGQMSMQQMMQQLQKASGQQQKLNKQIQQFLNKVQGERLSKNMKKRRKQLARQQRKIKQQLEEMNVSEDAKQRLMGDLQKIAEQMEQSAQDLEDGRRSRDLIKRQQQILTRLLNAQQSLRTQGKKQERRGQRANDPGERTPPGERPTPDEVDTLRRDLIRALEMGYNSDYEELIKRYFELLQQRKDTSGQ